MLVEDDTFKYLTFGVGSDRSANFAIVTKTKIYLPQLIEQQISASLDLVNGF